MKYNRFGLWFTPKEWLYGTHLEHLNRFTFEPRRILYAQVFGYFVRSWFYHKKFPFIFCQAEKLPYFYKRRFRLHKLFIWTRISREEADHYVLCVQEQADQLLSGEPKS
jgi:hypothetical protein